MTMPAYVVKPHRDKDFYVYWSDITESPYAWGDREFMLGYLKSRNFGPATERIGRADATGTSAMWPDPKAPAYGWHDPDRTVIFEQRGTVELADLPKLCEMLGRDAPEEEIAKLITPFEDDGGGSDG